MKRSLSLTNRRTAVLINLLSYPVMVWLIALAPFSQPMNGIGIGLSIGLFAATMLYLFYKTDLWIFANAPDDQLDERQNVVRNYAYRYAYILMSTLIMLLLVYLMLVVDTGGWRPNLPMPFTTFFWIISSLILSLPSIILAWMEPEI